MQVRTSADHVIGCRDKSRKLGVTTHSPSPYPFIVPLIVELDIEVMGLRWHSSPVSDSGHWIFHPGLKKQDNFET